MRLLFYILLLLSAIVYTYMAFVDLSFLTNRGRMGPGFFPRFIGVLLVISISIAMIVEARKGTLLSKEREGQALEASVLISLSIGFGIMLAFLGYLIATPVYVGAVLAYFNRQKMVLNGAIAVAVPMVIYVLFGNVLSASLPNGIWW